MTEAGKKVALITGITGQDGSYLAELLLSKGYQVNGLMRRSSSFNTGRVAHIYQDPHETDYKFKLWYGDLADSSVLIKLLATIKPDEVYNLGAQSHVRVSFDIPEYTADIDAIGTLRLLEAIRYLKSTCKFYQACYSEDTLALTSEGLKKYTEIKSGDLVYSINPHNREIELKPVLKVLEYDYSGNMIHFKSRRMDILVTPNHKMLIEDDKQSISFVDAQEVSSLSKYPRNSNLSLPTVSWKGRYIPEIDFSIYIDLENKSNNTYRNLLTSMKSEDFCYLFGLYIGDGYVKNDKKAKIKCSKEEFIKNRDMKGKFVSPKINELKEVKYKSNFIQFALPFADKARNKIIFILEKYKIQYTSDDINVNFSSYPLARMFKLAGENVYEKQIPKWILELSSNLLYKVFEGLIDSDGCVRKIKNERYSYTTVSPKLARDFIELTYKINKIPTLKIEQPKITYFKKDKRICGLNSRPIYRISVAYRNKNKIYKYNIRKEKYVGKIWCLEVKDNHNFLVYRNGKFAFSGNSSSEMFGSSPPPQNERTPFHPRSPYAVSKVFAHQIAVNYREAYGIFACSGILMNHESPRRGETFVTRKITRGIARILNGKDKKIFLGNLDAKRDWGYAPEYVEAMWIMMQQEQPDDYVIATGETHSVREFLEETFKIVGLDWNQYVEFDKHYLRPAEVENLCGDASKAREKLKWQPRVKFKDLARLMLIEDLKREGIDLKKYGLEERHPLTATYLKDVP